MSQAWLAKCAIEIAKEAGEPVELFGTLELVLSEDNSTGYKDVFYLKDRKKKPYQAKIWRPDTKDHINLGTFRGKHEAAIAVALYRRDGREDQPSPDKSRAEKSTRSPPRPARRSQIPLRTHLLPRSGLECTEKQQLGAVTTIDAPVPPIFQGIENSLRRNCRSRSCSRGPRPRALMRSPQALWPLRCLRSRVQPWH